MNLNKINYMEVGLYSGAFKMRDYANYRIVWWLWYKKLVKVPNAKIPFNFKRLKMGEGGGGRLKIKFHILKKNEINNLL